VDDRILAPLLQRLTPALAALTFAALLLLERRRPLRQGVEPKVRRLGRNLAMLGTSAACVAVLNSAFLAGVVGWVEWAQVGLLPMAGLPQAWRIAVGVVLLDYTLWHWHRWNHLVPFLWRFHAVHHADRDLDASTGARFHWGEMTLSVGYRSMQVVLIGADSLTLAAWQALLIPSVLFHHSNVRLPLHLERILVPFVVTPRMHEIHHSDVRAETNSNWSSLFTVWDRLHRTLRLDVPHEVVTIGLPAYRRAEAVVLGRMLVEPLRRQPDYWQGRLTRNDA
jgi:sterol desaturase/sphingolipid hydroxylase (fatty acid hydroxylase superfamily)